MEDLERVYQEELRRVYARLSFEPLPCEVCELPMIEHDWVDLDPRGFVKYCSEKIY